jgi:hypothetical protein
LIIYYLVCLEREGEGRRRERREREGENGKWGRERK